MSHVQMSRLADSRNDTNPWGTWEVRKPDGEVLDTTGSTSQGLQEAIAYACEHGYDLKVWGGQVCHKNGQNPVIIMCTETLVFPPLELANMEIGATLNFCGDSPQAEAILFDSIMASRIIFSGQVVVSPGWGCGVKFKPRSELPCDTNGPVITASKINLPSVVMVQGGCCIEFDATAGAITGNIFEILEPNGGNVGIRVKAGAATCYDHNHVLAREVHGQTSCIVAGDLANGAQVFANVWQVSLFPKSIGAEVFGRNERWFISIDDRESSPGQPACGFTLNPGASRNIIDVLRHDVGMPVNDASGNATNVITIP